ncbi:MAG: hypothetical protein QM723_34585 [Myxococcaceae bacterium]
MATATETSPADEQAPTSATANAPAPEPIPAPAPAPAPAVATTPAAPAPNVPATISAAPEEKKPLPFHGSAITYGPSATAYTFDQSADLKYNPTVGHRLGFLPEYHFADDLFAVKAKFWLSQEFTQSDTTTYKNEVEPSDIWVDLATEGFKEKVTGLKLSGDVRFTLPTSKASQEVGRIMTIGPSLTLSRKFDVLHGLTVGYTGRFTYRFNKFTTGQHSSPWLVSCGDTASSTCGDVFLTNGTRSTNYDVMHGLVVSFAPLEKLSFDGLFLYDHAFLYPLAATPGQFQGSQGLTGSGTDVRNLAVIYLSTTYQLTKVFGLTLGAFTFTTEPDVNGQYLFPIFNRYTVLYLEAGIDVEALASSLL